MGRKTTGFLHKWPFALPKQRVEAGLLPVGDGYNKRAFIRAHLERVAVAVRGFLLAFKESALIDAIDHAVVGRLGF
jgi:hypothetical protein